MTAGRPEPRIVVDVPRSTQVVFTVDDENVLVTQAAQLDRGADSAETRPHDDHIELLLAHKSSTVPSAAATVKRHRSC